MDWPPRQHSTVKLPFEIAVLMSHESIISPECGGTETSRIQWHFTLWKILTSALAYAAVDD